MAQLNLARINVRHWVLDRGLFLRWCFRFILSMYMLQAEYQLAKPQQNHNLFMWLLKKFPFKIMCVFSLQTSRSSMKSCSTLV